MRETVDRLVSSSVPESDNGTPPSGVTDEPNIYKRTGSNRHFVLSLFINRTQLSIPGSRMRRMIQYVASVFVLEFNAHLGLIPHTFR